MLRTLTNPLSRHAHAPPAPPALPATRCCLSPIPNLTIVFCAPPSSRSDSLLLSPAPNLTIVTALQPILRAPISIAVKMGADELAQK